MDVGRPLEQLVGEDAAAGQQDQRRRADREDEAPVLAPEPARVAEEAPGLAQGPPRSRAVAHPAAARRSASAVTPFSSCSMPRLTTATTSPPPSGTVGIIRTE